MVGIEIRRERGDRQTQRNGDCNFLTHSIRVRETLAPAQRVETLAHEVAHAILHSDGRTPRELAELEAESVAFVVCGRGLGLDTSDYSFGYVATWAGGSREAVDAIRASGDRISRASRRILAAVDAPAKVAA